MIRIDLYELLTQDPTINGIVGTNVWRRNAPQDTQPPYIIWNVLSGLPNNYMAEPPGIDNAVVQIDIYTDENAEIQMETLVERTEFLLDQVAHATSTPIDTWEEQPTKLIRTILSYSFWKNRLAVSG